MTNKRKKALRPKKRIPLLNINTSFNVIEAYNAIRTNLMFSLENKSCNKIVITSSVPNEGKSLNCCNIGINLGQTEKKVLIIDCDLRKPTVHRLFEKKGIPGLSELLAGMNNLEECLQKTEHKNLSIICGGTVPPNPTELLDSKRMEELLSLLSNSFDYILLDTPPVNVVSDSLILSAKVDGVLMVAREKITLHPEFKAAIGSLEFAKAKILGIILNGVEEGERHGYSRYGYKNYKRYYKEF